MVFVDLSLGRHSGSSQRREARHASPQQPNGLSRGAPMRFNAHAKGGIKNLKGATELELNFSARRPIKWAAYEHSSPVPKPSGSWQKAALRAIFASFASFFVERAFFATVMVFGPIRDIFKAGDRNRECGR